VSENATMTTPDDVDTALPIRRRWTAAFRAVMSRGTTGLVVALLVGAGLWQLAQVYTGGTDDVGSSGPYRLNCAEQPYSFRESTSPDGAVVERFELRAGDISPSDERYPDGRQRCEMVGQTDFEFGTPIWFAYSFRQTGTMPSSWVTMTQFHASPENGERTGKPPAFSMRQQQGQLQLLSRADTRVNTTTQVEPVVRHTMPWFPAGTWVDIVARVVFDPFGNGSITLWVNGTEEYASGPIPMGYNDTVGPHFSHGQYRGAANQTTVFEFANVEIGTTSLAHRVSAPQTLPG